MESEKKSACEGRVDICLWAFPVKSVNSTTHTLLSQTAATKMLIKQLYGIFICISFPLIFIICQIHSGYQSEC